MPLKLGGDLSFTGTAWGGGARELLYFLNTVKVWLTRKYAERLDGIDLRDVQVGDTLNLSRTEARLLMAEQWAELERRKEAVRTRHRRRVHDHR